MENVVWDPRLAPGVIALVPQPDGNWRGFTVKNGTLVQVRQGDPNTVLNLLLTHP